MIVFHCFCRLLLRRGLQAPAPLLEEMGYEEDEQEETWWHIIQRCGAAQYRTAQGNAAQGSLPACPPACRDDGDAVSD